MNPTSKRVSHSSWGHGIQEGHFKILHCRGDCLELWSEGSLCLLGRQPQTPTGGNQWWRELWIWRGRHFRLVGTGVPRHLKARGAAALAITKAKTWMWEEFGKAVISLGGELLTRTEDIVEGTLWGKSSTWLSLPLWKRQSLKTSPSLWQRSLKKSRCSSVRPWLDEICPEMLKTLDIVELSWLTCLFKFTWSLQQNLWNGRPGWWFPLLSMGTTGHAPVIRVSHYSASLEKSILLSGSCWRVMVEGSIRWTGSLVSHSQ